MRWAPVGLHSYHPFMRMIVPQTKANNLLQGSHFVQDDPTLPQLIDPVRAIPWEFLN